MDPRYRRPKVKICGLTRPEDAVLAADLGADFLGLNFYRQSPRYVEMAQAEEIAAAVRGRVGLVGVFVRRPTPEVAEIAARLGLDLLQFHGEELPCELTPFATRAIKVFRIREYVEPSLLAGFEEMWGFLFDYRHPDLYGGSGRSWRFSSLRELAVDKPTLIAGGLRPSNVRQAVASASPWGIDVCSGVEVEPGAKDPDLLRRLFEELPCA